MEVEINRILSSTTHWLFSSLITGGPEGKNREELDANGGLLGSKGSIYEGGIRVPTLMRWPKKITQKSKLKKGTSTDLIIDCSDLLPTFCELAGAPVPLGLSGVSLAPTLTGNGEQRVRDFLIHETNGKVKFFIFSKISSSLPRMLARNKELGLF